MHTQRPSHFSLSTFSLTISPFYSPILVNYNDNSTTKSHSLLLGMLHVRGISADLADSEVRRKKADADLCRCGRHFFNNPVNSYGTSRIDLEIDSVCPFPDKSLTFGPTHQQLHQPTKQVNCHIQMDIYILTDIRTDGQSYP